MDNSHQKYLHSLFAKISEWASVITFITGCVVLLGWALDIPALKSVLPGLVTMKANTALCFVLLGFALWMLRAGRADKRWMIVIRASIFIVIAIAGLTILEYAQGVNLGIDQMLFKEAGGAAYTTNPGRMAINTAACFILISFALLLADVRSQRGVRPGQFLAVAGVIISILSLIEYAYGISSLYYKVQGFTAMALHTAFIFLIVNVGAFFARPDSGIAGIITSDNMGGKVVRRVIPAVILIPPFFGWLKLWFERAGILPNELGVSFVATANVTAIVSCVIWMVIFINRADVERRKAEEVLRASEQHLQALNRQLQANQRQLTANNERLEADEKRLQLEIENRKRSEADTQKHLKDLQIFIKASVGREERIIELKKTIRRLEEELGK